MANVIRDRPSHELTEEQMSMLAGSLYEAGSHTTATYLHGLVLLLATHPDVQAKAFAELDDVVGETRSPTYEDTEGLPYLRALLQEAHRFRVLEPLSIPHRATRDLHYKGHLIPEGATLFGNIHAVFNDPDLFDAPEEFNPDRYLLTPHGTRPGVEDGDLRSTLVFGIGRRICPGMHLASASTILAAMKFIWAFQFSPAVDPATGKEVPLDPRAACDGLAVGVPRFACDIRCRSPAKAQIVRRTFQVDAAPTLSAFEYNLAKADKDWLDSVRVLPEEVMC